MKNEKAITLIALVVTIVVLLILAGVSISMLMGENGVIKQAKESKDKTIVGREIESISIAYSNSKIKNNMQNVTKEQLQEELNYNGENATVTGSVNILIVTFNDTKHSYEINQKGEISENDNEQNTDKDVTIPNGFFLVGGDLESGIVISDNANDEHKYKDQKEVGLDLEGNQFVWIPVNNPTEYLKTEDTKLYDIDSQIEEENINISESLKKYGGFFISRFEIAKENEKFISKAGKIADSNINLKDAINNARTMYPKNSEQFEAQSSLIYGKQWNLTMEYLSNRYDLSDSSSYGNYYNYGNKEENNNTISLSSTESLIECNQNGKRQKVQFSIQLGSGSSDVYMRFRTAKINGEFDLKEEVEQNESIIKRVSNYYYTPRITKTEKITVPMMLDIGGNSKKEDTSVQAKVRIEVIQADNFYPDFSADEPWGDVVIEEYGKLNINTINTGINKVSDLNIKNKIDLAFFTDFVERKIKINMKANTIKDTGNNDDWRTNNIFDLAGNLEEWTIDKQDKKYVIRGGKYFEKNGSEASINSKREVETTTKEDFIGYRAALYIK